MNKILEYLKELSEKHDEESAKEWIEIVKSLPNKTSTDWGEYMGMMTQRFIMNCNTTRFNAYIYKELSNIDQNVSIGGVDKLQKGVNRIRE